ncbi:MAG: Trk system potassium transporter TrkA [Chitinophagales bacterium]|nr:Trk system potassium transporter TrkA [Bacteroidota bacterium]MCB9043860.1 Trk system potassium transporter TrkA [Chitinophagales bacterium]
MKIVIAGAGEMGFHLANLLSKEAHDIVIIDDSQEILNHVANKLDVETIRGDSSSIDILNQANVGNADLLLSLTSSEQNNIITSIVGKKMGVKRTIARDNDNKYSIHPEQVAFFKQLGIDTLFSPRLLAAKEVVRLVSDAALTDLFEFEGGKLCVVGIHIVDNNAFLLNKTLAETSQKFPTTGLRLIAILRDGETIIPRGSDKVLFNDNVYFIAQKDKIDAILRLTGKKRINIKNIMILGGSTVGKLAAERLQKSYNVKLIEIDQAKSIALAEYLTDTLVINADGRDSDVLLEEDLPNIDVFLAVTNNTETNILSSLIAKKHGVAKTIAMVEGRDYITVSQNIGVDTLINKKLITANNIFRHIRKGYVQAITSLHGVDAEVIEFQVHANSKITQHVIKDLRFPKNALIGGVIRGNESFIPTADQQILNGDKVVVFVRPETIGEVEAFFE